MSETPTQQQTPEELRREIERTRRELGETVDALSHKADVKAEGSADEPGAARGRGRRRRGPVAPAAPGSETLTVVRHWWPVLKRTVAEFREDNLTDWAAALTYYAVLAIFPALIVLVSILGLVGESATQPLIDNLGTVAPGPAKEIFTSAIENLQGDQGAAGVLFVIGLLGALWSASGYVAAFMRASNAIYDIEEGRPIWKTLPVRVSLTLVLLTLLAISTIAVVLTGGLAEKVGDLVGLGSTAVERLEHRQVAGAAGGGELHVRAPLLGGAEREAPGLPLDQPGRHARRDRLADRLRGVRALRLELRLVQQDLRRARRRGRVPRLALDLEHRDSARRRVQRRARARARDRGRHAPARTRSRSWSRATRARWSTRRARERGGSGAVLRLRRAGRASAVRGVRDVRRWCSTARWPERLRRRSAPVATCRSAWSFRTSC